MSERMTHRVIYSGCGHDPAETSKGFCWQCRIAELEAKVAELEAQLKESEDELRDHLEAEGLIDECYERIAGWKEGDK